METRSSTGVWGPAVASFVIGGVAALGVALSPVVPFAYRSPIGHTALDSIEATIGLVAAYLLFSRGGNGKSQSDLGVTLALGLLVVTNLVFSVLPLVLHEPAPHTFSTWASLFGRVVGSVVLAASAFLPDRPEIRLRRPGTWLCAVLGLLTLVIASAVLLSESNLPSAVKVSIVPEASIRPHLGGHPIVLLTQGFQVLLYWVAAAGFGRRAHRSGDRLMTWLVAACIMGGWARVVYLLFPSLYSEWLYVGDFLRLASYIFLLVGVGIVIRDYWTRLAQVAVGEERRRVARELHDGLAQELAFITTHAKRVSSGSVESRAGLTAISTAADRALAEARRAINALSAVSEQTVGEAIVETVEELGRHTDVDFEMNVDESLNLTPETREHLLRILREAVWNSIRHGSAHRICVTLKDDGRTTLIVTDDGCGFEPARITKQGFGLVSMGERAAALGGELTIASQIGRGTTIEVVLR